MGDSQIHFDIVVLSQDVELLGLSSQQVLEWISSQREFNSRLQVAVSNSQVQLFGIQGAISPLPNLQDDLASIERVLRDPNSPLDPKQLLEAYLKPAKELRRIVAGGCLAEDIAEANSAFTVALYVLLYSDDFQARNNSAPELHILRLVARGPSRRMYEDYADAKRANSAATRALQLSTDCLDEIREQARLSREEVTRLEKLYHEKLKIEAPASHWKTVASINRKARWGWLATFAVLIMAGLITLLWQLDNIAIATKIISQEGGGPFAGLVVVTVPALASAWLLRQVARLFSRAHDLEIDAEHRRALAITFLGLAKDQDAQLGERDRTIILDALFRPQPPYISEDGPPGGIWEVITKAKT